MLHTRRTQGLFAILVAAAPAAIFLACGGANDNLPPPPPPPPAPIESIAPTATVIQEEKKPDTTPPPAITVKEGTPAADPTAPLPTVKITAPLGKQSIPFEKSADFAVKLDVKNWQTATGSQHVHLILDHRPYKPIYDTKAPVKLSDLTGGEALAPGQHVLVAFPSRPSHESVKTKGALAIIEFTIAKPTGKDVSAPAALDTTDIKKPLLIYSRPKGDYKGEMANHVLLDFQVANVTLAEGKEHVNITVTGPGINGELKAVSNKIGAPFYMDSLQNGSYTIKLDLVGADDKLLPGPWNSTSRTIHVDHDAPADPMPHAMGDMKADAGAPPATSAKPKASTTTAPAPK